MSEIQMWVFWRAVLAEFLGMIIFIFIGLTAAIGDPNNSYPDQEVKVAFAFGLAFATLAYCIGHISGAHLNPAVTVGLLTSCQMSALRASFYVIAQMLGAVAGSAIVYGVRPETTESLGVNKLKEVGPHQGFGTEFMLALQLVLCVLTVTDKRHIIGRVAPLAVGFSVVVGHLAGISYTGCGINPARSFGPAIMLGCFDDHWVFWAGLMSSSLVAALLYNHLLAPRDELFRGKTRVSFCWAQYRKMNLVSPFWMMLKMQTDQRRRFEWKALLYNLASNKLLFQHKKLHLLSDAQICDLRLSPVSFSPPLCTQTSLL